MTSIENVYAGRALTFVLKAEQHLPVRRENVRSLTPLRAHSRLGTNYLELESECPQNGSAVLKGLSPFSLNMEGLKSVLSKYGRS